MERNDINTKLREVGELENAPECFQFDDEATWQRVLELMDEGKPVEKKEWWSDFVKAAAVFAGLIILTQLFDDKSKQNNRATAARTQINASQPKDNKPVAMNAVAQLVSSPSAARLPVQPPRKIKKKFSDAHRPAATHTIVIYDLSASNKSMSDVNLVYGQLANFISRSEVAEKGAINLILLSDFRNVQDYTRGSVSPGPPTNKYFSAHPYNSGIAMPIDSSLVALFGVKGNMDVKAVEPLWWNDPMEFVYHELELVGVNSHAKGKFYPHQLGMRFDTSGNILRTNFRNFTKATREEGFLFKFANYNQFQILRDSLYQLPSRSFNYINLSVAFKF